MEAFNLFPGSVACRTATTEALWPGPGFACCIPEGLMFGGGEESAGVLGSAGGDRDVDVYVGGDY